MSCFKDLFTAGDLFLSLDGEVRVVLFTGDLGEGERAGCGWEGSSAGPDDLCFNCLRVRISHTRNMSLDFHISHLGKEKSRKT